MNLKERTQEGWCDALAGEVPQPVIEGPWNLEDHRAIEEWRDEWYLQEALTQLKRGFDKERMGELVCLWLRSKLMIRSAENSLYVDLNPLMKALAATDKIRVEFDTLMTAWSESLVEDEHQTREGAMSWLDGLKLIRPYLDQNQRGRFDRYYRKVKGNTAEENMKIGDDEKQLELPLDSEGVMENLPKFAPLAARWGRFLQLLEIAGERGGSDRQREAWVFLVMNYEEIENEHCFPRPEKVEKLVLAGEMDSYLDGLAYIAANEASVSLEKTVRARAEIITSGIISGDEEFSFEAGYAPNLYDLIKVGLMLAIEDVGKRKLLASLT